MRENKLTINDESMYDHENYEDDDDGCADLDDMIAFGDMLLEFLAEYKKALQESIENE